MARHDYVKLLVPATVLMVVRACSLCATKTEATGRFCPECGAVLVGPEERSESALAGTAPSPAASSGALLGLTIDGQFAIDSVIGGGAFGTVYRGSQVGLDRPIALKVPTHEIARDPVMAKRFAREARSAARVHHPGVVAIYAVGELADGRPYLAMQYVEGESLAAILVDGPIAPARALGIIRAIASALSETHAADVVHRDLKPSNIMWRRDRNGDDRITLVDFGIAVCKPGNADASRLTSNGLIGTPHYMSPEQAHGDEVDARADLYALGCLLFELVTGTPPFEGSGFEVLLAHLGKQPPAPSELDASVPDVIDQLCATLLAKAPADRPASADALVAAIDDALDVLDGRVAPPAPHPARRRLPSNQPTRRDLPPTTPPRRARRWLVGVVAASIALAAAGFAALHGINTGAGAAIVEAEPEDTPNGPVDPHGTHRRDIFQDDGELVLRALVPDPIAANQPIRPHLEIKNKLGQPIVATEIVVTVTDDHGAVTGLAAHPHAEHSGHYGFRYTFPRAGHYILRVFPPSDDSAFEIPLDVR